MANVTAITFNYILVIVFLFPLNVGVSPCFHCTVLVPVYRMYTSYFHNTQLLVPVTDYILPVCIIQVLLVSVWACGLIYSWNVSLVRSRWESAHIQFNLCSVYYVFQWWDLVSTSSWERLHPVQTAMLIVNISIRAHSVIKTHSFNK